MSHNADGARQLSSPPTAADMLAEISRLAQSDPRVLEQQLSLDLEAPQGIDSEEAWRNFIRTVDHMRASARLLELYLNQLSQLAGDQFDTFTPNDFRCASYYATLKEQDATYKRSLQDLMADFEIFLKPKPAGGAEEAEPTACKTVGDVYKKLQRMLTANPDLLELSLENDEPVQDAQTVADLQQTNDRCMALARLSEIISLAAKRQAEMCRDQRDDLKNPDLQYVADELKIMRAPRAQEHACAMHSLCEAVHSSDQASKKRRIGE